MNSHSTRHLHAPSPQDMLSPSSRRVMGTPFVRFPFAPNCLHSKPLSAQNEAWEVADQHVRVSFPHSDPELNFSLSHTITNHRWPGTITLAITSTRTPLPHDPPGERKRKRWSRMRTRGRCRGRAPACAVARGVPYHQHPRSTSPAYACHRPRL
jgi:hypothetical protein